MADTNKRSTASDFLKNSQIEVYTDMEGRTLDIRPIPQFDFWIGFSATLKTMMGDDDAYEDENRRAEFIESLPESDQKQLLEAHWHDIKRVVCKAVQSIPLANKRQNECNPKIGEVSIDNLADVDVYTIWRRVNVLSGLPDPNPDPNPDITNEEPAES